MIEIEDRAYKQATLEVRITTPKDGMGWDEGVVRRSAKQLADKMSEFTSSGFCRALEDALRDRRISPCDILEVE